jgi:hypothetical protein
VVMEVVVQPERPARADGSRRSKLFREEAFARMKPLRDSQSYPMRLKARFAVARKPM